MQWENIRRKERRVLIGREEERRFLAVVSSARGDDLPSKPPQILSGFKPQNLGFKYFDTNLGPLVIDILI